MAELTIEQVLTLLLENTVHIAAWTGPLTLAQLHAPAAESEWSPNDILAHLRSCADVWGDCIRRIVAEEVPTIRAINPRTWIEQTDYQKQKFKASFEAFTVQHVQLLEFLRSLPRKSWDRKARITGAGKPLERTVYFYAHRLATHERSHVKQFKRILNMTHG